MLALQGPKSQAALQPLVEGLDLSEIGYYKFAFATVAGIENVRISRTGYTGEDGFEIYFPNEHAVRVWNELLEAAKALTAAAKKQLIDSLVEDLYSSMDTPEAI